MKFKPLLCIPIIYMSAIMPRMTHRPDYSSLMGYYYAHRGLHDNSSDAPENSIPAFLKAVGSGYGIELDVQLTKDRIPVVFHDDTLKRVCGISGSVKDYTYTELSQFHLFDTEETIPKLSDVLALVDGQVPLIIEIKFPENPTTVCQYTEFVLRNYKGTYCIESFHPLAVKWFKDHRPELIRGQLSSNFFKSDDDPHPSETLVHLLVTNFISKPDFIAYDHRYKNNLSRLICRYVYKSLSISWTIRSQEDLDTCQDDFDLFIFEGFIPNE